MTPFERLPNSILERLRSLPTSSLSDALDKLGLVGAVEGLKPMSSGNRIAGQAVTLRYLPVGVKGGTVGDFLHLAQAGDVIVIDNRGRTDCTVWGNILTEAAKRQDLAGTIIDGVNRDVNESVAINYPIWSRAAHMRTGKDRVTLDEVNVSVGLGKVRVDPGDAICADDSGVVVIPLAKVEAVLSTAEEIDGKETKIVAAMRSGIDLAEARRIHGYHNLQTR